MAFSSCSCDSLAQSKAAELFSNLPAAFGKVVIKYLCPLVAHVQTVIPYQEGPATRNSLFLEATEEAFNRKFIIFILLEN